MNKYEKIYLKALHRSKDSGVSWIDSAIAALAVDLENYTGETFEIGGPYGLRAEIMLISKSYALTLTPSFRGDKIELYYDTGEQTQSHQPSTIGAANGFNNVQARLPNSIGEIVAVMTHQVECRIGDADYVQQQSALAEIASELGVVCFKPRYHGIGNDKNTVLFYTAEDAERNLLVDKQVFASFRNLSDSIEEKGHIQVPTEKVHLNFFWSFENSDIDNQLNYDFANAGKLDLRSNRWRDILKGAIRFALANKCQRDHIAQTGGWGALREADEVYNDLNREKIAAFKMWHENIFLGNITFSGEQRLAVIAGKESVYKQYLDETIYNFSCSFCVAERDQKLERMIRAWNQDERLPKSGKDIEKITRRIEALGGFSMLWF